LCFSHPWSFLNWQHCSKVVGFLGAPLNMPIVTNNMLVDCFNAKPQQLQVNLVQKKAQNQKQRLCEFLPRL